VSVTVHPLRLPGQTQTTAGHRAAVARSWEQFGALRRSSEPRAAPTLLPKPLYSLAAALQVPLTAAALRSVVSIALFGRAGR